MSQTKLFVKLPDGFPPLDAMSPLSPKSPFFGMPLDHMLVLTPTVAATVDVKTIAAASRKRHAAEKEQKEAKEAKKDENSK